MLLCFWSFSKHNFTDFHQWTLLVGRSEVAASLSECLCLSVAQNMTDFSNGERCESQEGQPCCVISNDCQIKSTLSTCFSFHCQHPQVQVVLPFSRLISLFLIIWRLVASALPLTPSPFPLTAIWPTPIFSSATRSSSSVSRPTLPLTPSAATVATGERRGRLGRRRPCQADIIKWERWIGKSIKGTYSHLMWQILLLGCLNNTFIFQ